MNPVCPSDISIFRKEDKIIVLNPRFPSWAVVNSEGLALLQHCTGASTLQEIADDLSLDLEDVQEFVQTLRTYRILDDESQEKEKGMSSSGLEGIWLNVTSACNLRCLTCYQSSGLPHPKELTLKEITGLFKQIKELKSEREPQTVILTGGEPLLRPDIWKICAAARNTGHRVNLISNGTLIDDETASKIASHVDNVQVSLDGMQDTNDTIRGKGSFREAFKGIKALLNANIVPSVGIVATGINSKEILPLLDFLIEQGISSVRMRPIIHQGRGALHSGDLAISCEQYHSLIETIYERGFSSNPSFLQVERFAGSIETPANNALGCPAGQRMLSISSTGDVYPCIAGHMPGFCFGSIREASLGMLMRSEGLRPWRSFNVNVSLHCKGCEWRNFCGGGCKVSAFLHTGSIEGGDPLCEAFKSLYHDTLMRMIS
jgi:radical SAM protein with 4Fe4S-binding SPASM domain